MTYYHDGDLYCDGCAPDGAEFDASSGEADAPQHCGECGAFLENPLTGEGYTYVAGLVAAQDGKPDVLALWDDHYGNEPEYINALQSAPVMVPVTAEREAALAELAESWVRDLARDAQDGGLGEGETFADHVEAIRDDGCDFADFNSEGTAAVVANGRVAVRYAFQFAIFGIPTD